jgi:lipoprotein-anchoring transpeptidase ErfK/SrfK
MTRALALLVAAIAVLAGSGPSRAQELDMRDLMGGGPNFFGRGGSPIQRETVNNPTNYAPGTIFINTAERRLYLILANGQALRYGIGVGRDGFRWSGVHRISAKKEWPGWTPPAQMLARRRDLPRHMAGGIENPLGARALYLGSTLYRIHGSNEPETIGQAVSSGCFRMTNEDVTDLYSRVSVGTTVVVRNQGGPRSPDGAKRNPGVKTTIVPGFRCAPSGLRLAPRNPGTADPGFRFARSGLRYILRAWSDFSR